MDNAEVRLRLLEAFLPQAAVASIRDPNSIITIVQKLEQYVVDAPAKRKLGRPPKDRKEAKPFD